MRRISFALLILFGVVTGAVLLAGTGLGITAGAAAGILVVGIVAVLGTSTDRLVYAAVGILVLTITWNGFRIGGGAFGDLLMAMAFAALVVSLVVERRWPVIPGWLALAGIGYALAGLLSGVFPASHALTNQIKLEQLSQAVVPGFLPPRSNTTFLIKFELAAVLLPLLVVAAGTTRARCSRLLDLWTIGCVINAAVGVLDIAGIHLAPHALAGTRSSGLTIHPNYLALTSLMGAPIAMIWVGRSRRWTWAGLISVLVLVGGVYASGSRDGIVTMVGLIVLTAFAVPRFRRAIAPALPLIAGGFAAIVTLVLLFTNLGNQILHQVRLGGNGVSAAASDMQRSNAAHVAFAQIRARPIQGVGFSVIEDAQVIYLQVLAAGGLIAGAAFVTYVGGVLRAAWRAWTLEPADEVVAATVVVIGWLINGIVDSQLADKYVYVVPGILIALAVTAVQDARARQQAAAPVPSGTVSAPARTAPAVPVVQL